MSVRTVPVADTKFLLREEGSGSGTPVLLLHGVPETSSVWRDLAPQLAAGRRVLAPDLPGLGGSTYTGGYDAPSLVAQLVALIEAEVDGPVDVVGHDWGGSLALGLTGARPDLVRRLCVANAPYREVPLLRAVHIPFFAVPFAPELLFRLGGRRVVDVMLDLAWKASVPLDAERRSEYQAAYTEPDKVTAMLGYYRAAARPKLAAALKRSAAAATLPRVRAEKMLVLWGALDPVLPIGVGESVVRDLGADCVMVTVPGAGHYVIEEAPAVVAQVLIEFLGDDPEPAKAPPRKTAARKAPAKKAPAKKAPPEVPPSPASS